MTTEPGTVLTCDNPDCDCEIEVRKPCPHGDTYSCGCGHPLTARSGDPIPPTPGA